MLIKNPETNIFLYKSYVDMRKAIDGLAIILANELSKDPQSGDFFIFTNRSRDKLKCLYWHNNGFVLFYKRLEKGRFKFSKNITSEQIAITQEQLDALLMGFDFYLLNENGFNKIKNYC